jgi:hypothetical protein
LWRVSLEGFSKTTYVRYEVVVEAEQGTTGASGGNVIKGTYNYGSKISIDCWLDTSKQYTVKKCYGGIGGVRSGGGRQGGNGGNSLVLKDGITDIVVAGAGGGNGSGNGKYGASAFWNATTMTYSDYSYLGTDPRLTFFTRPDYFPNVALIGMKDHNNTSSAANIFYGLNAQNHYNYGGGGGWTSGGQGYRENTSGSQYNGGNGTVPNYDRRSSGGGGGGAGYYGGGGGAEVNTSDGERGSPGGGSGSSYYINSNSYPYNTSFNYLSATTNTNAKITIKNKKTNASTTWTFSGLSDENTISLP